MKDPKPTWENHGQHLSPPDSLDPSLTNNCHRLKLAAGDENENKIRIKDEQEKKGE